MKKRPVSKHFARLADDYKWPAMPPFKKLNGHRQWGQYFQQYGTIESFGLKPMISAARLPWNKRRQPKEAPLAPA